MSVSTEELDDAWVTTDTHSNPPPAVPDDPHRCPTRRMEAVAIASLVEQTKRHNTVRIAAVRQ